MRLPCCVFSSGALAARSSPVRASPLNESAQYLAVISEAMLRLASLLRTNHMLGGSETSELDQMLSLVLTEIHAEIGVVEG